MRQFRLSRKIYAPTLPSIIVHREQLLHLLENALRLSEEDNAPLPYQLVLLCAPAGYGKTTLLAEAVQQNALTCCWYFLEPSDMETRTFLTTLLASIRHHFPDFGVTLDALLPASDADLTMPQPFLDALLKALSTELTTGCIFAFCNYQEVNENDVIADILNYLLQHLPPHCLIVIESRAIPKLELAPLIVGRHMYALGRNHLQFSVQDVCALARLQGLSNFSEEEAAQLVTSFQGWITGILLGSRLGSAQFDLFSALSASGLETSILAPNRQDLFTWVVKDIFRADQAIYHFLKHTSLLEMLTPTLCDTLLETTNAAALLEYAERQGLFVLRVREAKELTYQCHPVLRNILQEELRRREPETYRSLHAQLAQILLQNHEDEAALHHTFESQQYELATEVLLENAAILLNRGQSEVVLRLVKRFPSPWLQAHPRLLLLQVQIFVRRGNFATVRRLLDPVRDQVTLLDTAEKNSEERLLHAEFALAFGQLALAQGNYTEAQYRFRQTLDHAPTDERVLRITAHQQLGICLILGDAPLHEGITQLQQALQLCHPQRDERLVAELHHQLANAYAWTGNYIIAEHHRQCISLIQKRLDQPRSIINNLTGIAILHMRQGHVKEAEAYFQRVLEQTDLPRLRSSKAYALLGLGELAWTCQRWHAALAHLEEARALAQQLEDRYLLNGVLHIYTMVYLRMGETATAQWQLDQAILHPEETRSYEGILHQLVRGTLLLAQQKYGEAQTQLEAVAALTEQRELFWLHLQALLRLTACYLATGQSNLAQTVLRQVKTLTATGIYDYGIQEELRAYPQLHPLLREQEKAPVLQSIPQSQLRVCALGEPAITLEGVPLTHWRMARALELCFYLLNSPQPRRKEQIIAALWPEEEEEHANQTFRSTIYYIRQTLGKACLVHRSGLYRLDLQANYGSFWYDVAHFEEQQQIAKAALEENDHESATQAFEHMVDLYQGDYVQAFYSDWCIKRREQLRASLMEARQQLAHLAWKRDAYDESLNHWQHLLTLDPCLESAHAGIMRCYIRQGKRGLALRQYQRCCRELHEQLGAKPGPALQKLHQSLAGHVAVK